MKRNIMVSLVTCLVAGTIAVVSKAQLGGSTASELSVPELVAYRGYVERGGVPYAGTVDLRFSIFGGPTGGNPYWQGLYQSVQVAGGRFSVQLGSGSYPFTLLINGGTPDGRPLFQQDALYLGVETKFPGEAGFTTLSNRQRLLAAPYAMTARQAERLNTTDNVSVGGALGVTGDVTASSNLSVTGNVKVTTGTLVRAAAGCSASAYSNCDTMVPAGKGWCALAAFTGSPTDCSVAQVGSTWRTYNYSGAGACQSACFRWDN